MCMTNMTIDVNYTQTQYTYHIFSIIFFHQQFHNHEEGIYWILFIRHFYIYFKIEPMWRIIDLNFNTCMRMTNINIDVNYTQEFDRYFIELFSLFICSYIKNFTIMLKNKNCVLYFFAQLNTYSIYYISLWYLFLKNFS